MKTMRTFTLTALSVLTAVAAFAQTTSPPLSAPGFKLKDAMGNDVQLSSFLGKYVVLEWTNKDCDYVKKWYDAKKMQGVQKDAMDKGVVWLVIDSTPMTAGGYMTMDQAKDHYRTAGSTPSYMLWDSDGAVAKMYGVKFAPTAVVIDKAGKIIYQGAFDDKSRSLDADSLDRAHNYVMTALEESMSGKMVTRPSTEAYGCPIGG